MNYFFFSFSYLGRNAGAIIVSLPESKVKLDSQNEENLATNRVIEVLGDYPKCDDTQIYKLTAEEFQEETMKLDRFYTRQEMLDESYKLEKSTKHK